MTTCVSPVAMVVAPMTEHMTAPMQKASPRPACRRHSCVNLRYQG